MKTINDFKNLAERNVFHFENCFGVTYSIFGFKVFKTVEKLTGKASQTYQIDGRPVTKTAFLLALNSPEKIKAEYLNSFLTVDYMAEFYDLNKNELMTILNS
jgi:hypothetical protein